LEEQRTILGQLAEERRALAEERAQFNVKQRLKMDQEIKDSVKVKHVRAKTWCTHRVLDLLCIIWNTNK
jgi:hypothetical protein